MKVVRRPACLSDYEIAAMPTHPEPNRVPLWGDPGRWEKPVQTFQPATDRGYDHGKSPAIADQAWHVVLGLKSTRDRINVAVFGH